MSSECIRILLIRALLEKDDRVIYDAFEKKIEEAERQRKIEENKAAVSWKCLGCGRVNHGFQEMCACGQRRDDN